MRHMKKQENVTCNRVTKTDNRNSLTVDVDVQIRIKDFTIIMLLVIKDLVEK